MPRGRVTGPAPGTSAAEDCAYCDCTGRDIKVEIPATPLEPPDRSTPVLSAFICVHQRPLWGFGFRVGPEEKHIWLSLSGRSVQNRGARDCLRPGSASPLARRGSPSGLQYGYARILRLSLSFSRLSTFVPRAQVYTWLSAPVWLLLRWPLYARTHFEKPPDPRRHPRHFRLRPHRGHARDVASRTWPR